MGRFDTPDLLPQPAEISRQDGWRNAYGSRRQRGMTSGVLIDPGDLLGEGAGHQIERDGRFEHLGVVDRA